MIAKRIIDRIAAEDVKIQCALDPQCHRKDLHEGDCKTLAVVVVENIAREMQALVAWARGKR